jgi:hypothetical protein
VDLHPFLRDFRGNTGGRGLGVWAIDVDRVSDFSIAVWRRALPHLHRGIIFDSDTDGQLTCRWMDDFPSFENIDMFLQIYDCSGKRALPWSGIDSSKLQSFMTKTINLYIHRYSSNVDCKNNFNLAKRTLIDHQSTDRSGAATISAMDAMVIRLKNLHSQHYEAFDINWGLWANDILSRPNHMQELSVNSGPPAHLIRLFRHRTMPAETTLANLHHVNLIGLDLVNTILNDIQQIKNQFRRCNDMLVDGQTMLEAVENTLEVYQRQFTVTTNVIAATETNSSLDAISHIVNQDDVDHMQPDGVNGSDSEQ